MFKYSQFISAADFEHYSLKRNTLGGVNYLGRSASTILAGRRQLSWPVKRDRFSPSCSWFTTCASGGSATPVHWTKISNVKSYSGFDGSASEIERTNFDSTAKEFILGLFDPGAFSIEVDQDNSDAGQLALMTALVTGVAKSFKLLLPNGNTATFTAYVKKFNSQGAVDQAIRSSAELRISGPVSWA